MMQVCYAGRYRDQYRAMQVIITDPVTRIADSNPGFDLNVTLKKRCVLAIVSCGKNTANMRRLNLRILKYA